MYGVKIAITIVIENRNEYIGFGRLSPWILDPNQSSKVGQNTNMIRGVPEPAKNRNGVESTTKHEASSETLFLNHRFSSKIKRIPSSNPIIILGSLIEYGVNPKNLIEVFCNNLYGKSTKLPSKASLTDKWYESVADCISASDRPSCAIIGKVKSRATNAIIKTIYPITNLCRYRKSLEIVIFFTISLYYSCLVLSSDINLRSSGWK